MRKRKRRVLVVDDDEPLCRLLVAQLGEMGCRPAYAISARQALKRLPEIDPDLILLDIRMPETGGLELLRRFQEEKPKIPVVMITAHGDLSSARRAMRFGAHDYLTKPITRDLLRSILADYAR